MTCQITIRRQASYLTLTLHVPTLPYLPTLHVPISPLFPPFQFVSGVFHILCLYKSVFLVLNTSWIWDVCCHILFLSQSQGSSTMYWWRATLLRVRTSGNEWNETVASQGAWQRQCYRCIWDGFQFLHGACLSLNFSSHQHSHMLSVRYSQRTNKNLTRNRVLFSHVIEPYYFIALRILIVYINTQAGDFLLWSPLPVPLKTSSNRKVPCLHAVHFLGKTFLYINKLWKPKIHREQSNCDILPLFPWMQRKMLTLSFLT